MNQHKRNMSRTCRFFTANVCNGMKLAEAWQSRRSLALFVSVWIHQLDPRDRLNFPFFRLCANPYKPILRNLNSRLALGGYDVFSAHASWELGLLFWRCIPGSIGWDLLLAGCLLLRILRAQWTDTDKASQIRREIMKLQYREARRYPSSSTRNPPKPILYNQLSLTSTIFQVTPEDYELCLSQDFRNATVSMRYAEWSNVQNES